MSDNESSDEKPFAAERAKQGRAVCKKCKQKCQQGELRIAKLVANPFGSGKMKSWHHLNCMFEVFLKQRPTTKRLEGPDDLEGWNSLSEDDRQIILEKIKETEAFLEIKLVHHQRNPQHQRQTSQTTRKPNQFHYLPRKIKIYCLKVSEN